MTGETAAHDPSSIIKDGSTYYYFTTGPGIGTRSSLNETNWVAGPNVFTTPPAWTTQAVPAFAGTFWAPDVTYRNGLYYLYYAVSSFGSQDSAIGMATSPTLNPAAPNYWWTDRGPVIQSNPGDAFNTIDPSVMQDAATGREWMSFGSYWNGIYVTELDPSTGKVKAGAQPVRVASKSAIEASALIKHGNFYYLFVNWDGCCAGIDSTYNIRVGRSTSPTGPFLDKNGLDLRNGGGTLFLDDDGNRIGPGHFAIFNDGTTQDQFSYHYYDGNRNGAPTFGLSNLYWTADNWPSVAPVNPDWSGANSGNWSTAANWKYGAVPNGVGGVANFVSTASGRYAVTIDGGGKTVSRINFASPASYTIGTYGGNGLTLDAMALDAQATINVSAGGHAINSAVTSLDPLGVNVTPPDSTLTLGGGTTVTGGLNKYGFGTLSLGGTNAIRGSVFVRNGTLDITGIVSVGGFSSVGQVGNETATMTVRGTGKFTTTTDLNIGDTGSAADPATGTLNLRDGASVTVSGGGGFYVGSGFFAGSKAVGTVNQSGGTLTAAGNFDGAFTIGGRASALATGTYNLSGGTVHADTNLRVGGSGSGTMNQTGGVVYATKGVTIGHAAGSTGVWNLSNGTVIDTYPAGLWTIGAAGAGTLTVSGSGLLRADGGLKLGNSAGSAGTVNLDGGAITTSGVSRGGGSGTFNFNGGTLRALASSTTFLQGLTRANVKAGGATIDTQALEVTIAQPLLHDASLGPTRDGGLTKLGEGTLVLSGASTFTGTTGVSAGTLRVDGSLSSPVDVKGTGTLAGSGQVRSNVTSAADVSPGADGPGRLGVTGTYQQSASGHLLIGIGGVTAGSSHDRLDVGGSATLGGTLELSLEEGFLPSLGDRFTVLSAASRAGAFASVTGVTVPAAAHLSFAVTYSPTAVLVTAALPGDIDLDEVVGPGDFNLLASHFGQTAQTWSTGDLNGDGTVGPADFNLLASTFGEIAAGTTAAITDTDRAAMTAFANAIPEPGTLSMAVLVISALVSRRRRQT